MPKPKTIPSPEPVQDPTVDATPDLDPATFDLDEWLSGVSPTIRAVTLYRRADLLADIDEAERRLSIARASEESGERGLGDESTASLQRHLEDLYDRFQASAVVFKVQGRSDAHRDKIAKGLKKRGVEDKDEVILHQLADAIVEPQGVTVEHLRRLGDVAEAQLKLLLTAAALANFQPPKVDAPFSRGSSGSRGGRTS